jgi:hypothetical protein
MGYRFIDQETVPDVIKQIALETLNKAVESTKQKRKTSQAIADVGPFPITKGENAMIIRQTCVYVVMLSGILLFAGCAFLADKPQGGAQFDSTLGSQSKSLAGSYRDIGSDGSIKPHPESSYKMSQEPQSRTEGAITLGKPGDMPDLKTGGIRSTGGTTPRSGSDSNSTGSSRGASGADGK